MEENTQLPKEDNNIPLTVEIVDLIIDMLSADASRARMEKEILKLLNKQNGAIKANETIKVLTYDNNRLKGEVEGYKEACEELKRWKMNAAEELTIVGAYAHKHLEVNPSDSIAQLVMAHTNECRILLEEVLSKHECGLLPDRFIYEKIKTFLYGE